ncbi:hypothetical protein B0H16DRAFT_744266 [Mycena metata]|uniref:Uncharacterized protein n=1 Tax=Mycena metata TaxID=1033252 RepID=A0AAD7NCV5_9AGAR|nr:hypothetical protein B0H16DRAFT_744266 [Mycena metata]
MATVVPLSSLSASAIDRSLTQRYLFPKNDVRAHRQMEYLWGLEIYTIDPTHELSILHIQKSMETLPPGSWTLVPTEETLAAMQSLQKHNYTVPISERKSFLTELSALEYEYMFIPLSTDVEFFILDPERAPRRFSPPYNNFPRVMSSANPFFVTFYSRFMIRPFHASNSQEWHRLWRRLTMEWVGYDLPEDFLLSCYPDSLVSESAAGSGHHADSKFGGDETVLTPIDEGPSFVPDKGAFVHEWLRRDCDNGAIHERLILSTPWLWPPAPREEQARPLKEAIQLYPCWHRETERGRNCTRRLFRNPPPRHMISCCRGTGVCSLLCNSCLGHMMNLIEKLKALRQHGMNLLSPVAIRALAEANLDLVP